RKGPSRVRYLTLPGRFRGIPARHPPLSPSVPRRACSLAKRLGFSTSLFLSTMADSIESPWDAAIAARSVACHSIPFISSRSTMNLAHFRFPMSISLLLLAMDCAAQDERSIPVIGTAPRLNLEKPNDALDKGTIAGLNWLASKQAADGHWDGEDGN